MSIETLTADPEVEADRLRRLEEMNQDDGPDWTDHFVPGSFGCHELLDRTALVARFVEETILDHPACSLDSEWYALADRAVTALNELYQRVGSVESPPSGG